MMYKFHITGYAATEKGSSYYCGSCPFDVTVYAERVSDALVKAEAVMGEYISTTHRKIVVEEILDEKNS